MQPMKMGRRHDKRIRNGLHGLQKKDIMADGVEDKLAKYLVDLKFSLFRKFVFLRFKL